MSSRRVLLLLSALLSTVLVAGPASASTTSFRDVSGSVHAPAVSALAADGIVNGCTDGKFCPTSGLTRGQVASVLYRALDLEPVDGQGFGDTADSVHREAIDAIAAAGITVGCSGGRFCPTDPITRGQLASLLTRALSLPSAPSGTYFADISGSAHGAAIATLADQGIAAGCSLVAFCPSAQLTRGQGATFVARGLDLIDRVQLAPYAERKAQHEQQLAQARSASPGARAVEVALAQVGKPYQWGGNGPSSFDCSGLTRYAWRAAGVDLPRTSADQHRATQRISRSQLQPGDLVFYYSPVGHVAMYIGNGRTVEAPTSNNTVRVSTTGLSRSGIVGYGRPR